jgi:hypothetical protein
MTDRAARRRAQEAEQRAQEAMAAARPNEPPTIIADADKCPASFGRCDFTMKGRDGIRRCWYCARRRPC